MRECERAGLALVRDGRRGRKRRWSARDLYRRVASRVSRSKCLVEMSW